MPQPHVTPLSTPIGQPHEISTSIFVPTLTMPSALVRLDIPQSQHIAHCTLSRRVEKDPRRGHNGFLSSPPDSRSNPPSLFVQHSPTFSAHNPLQYPGRSRKKGLTGNTSAATRVIATRKDRYIFSSALASFQISPSLISQPQATPTTYTQQRTVDISSK